jgi:NodT family efflux transporter outer membrane factor (OMF) lipoprotein
LRQVLNGPRGLGRLMPLWHFVLAMTFALCVAGCAVGPDYASPEIKLPALFETWRSAESNQPGIDRAQAANIVAWWKTLRDPELNSLIERAIPGNPDIEVALDRVQQAREHEIVVLGAALPNLGAGGSVARGSGTDSVKSPRIPASLDAGINTTGFQEVQGVAGFDAGWELDLVGKYRRALEAARYDTQAAVEARNAAVITVVAEVARNYVLLRGLQLRVTYVRENIARAERNVNLAVSRYNQGLTNQGDVLLARRELEALNSVLPSLNAAIFEAESQIALLLGTFSGDVIGELQHVRKLPQTPERLRAGRPIDLLRRRPDIRRVETQFAAATARIGVVAADLFPRVSVTAGLGVQGGREAVGASPPVRGLIWSVGPGAYWPLLDFGRLDAVVDEAEFRARELFSEYRRIVIGAVEEVNTAIIRYQSDIETVRHLRKAVDASRSALEFQTGRYEQGISDFLNVLDALRQEYELEEQLVTAQISVALAYIALYKALGGGWELFENIPPIPVPEPAIAASVRRLSTPLKLQDR